MCSGFRRSPSRAPLEDSTGEEADGDDREDDRADQDLVGENADELDDQARLVSATERTLLPSIEKPEDIAEAVTFLCSDAARFITAQVLPVDDGWSV